MKTIIHVITGLGDGGAENQLCNLIAGTINYKHIVISMRSGGKYANILRSDNITVYELSKFSLRNILEFIKTIRRGNIVAIQGWLYHGIVVSWLLSLFLIKRNIWSIHVTNLHYKRRFDSRKIMPHILKCALVLKRADIVYCAQASRDWHEKVYKYPSEFGQVIRNGYDHKLFNLDASHDAQREVDLCVFGHVSRFHPQKDQITLIKAFKLFLDKLQHTELGTNRAELRLYGSDLTLNNKILTDLIDDLELHSAVRLNGPSDDIRTIYGTFDLFVLSSAFGEAFPNVLCEAMLSGVPCITTDVGDSKVIVGNTGWIVPPNDPQQLSQAMFTAFNITRNKSIPTNYNESVRTRIKDNFSTRQMILSFTECWEKNA